MSWLFDSVMGFLKSPGWALPVMSFIDDNCVVFDDEEENKLAYMDIYGAFREMVDSLLDMHLQEMGVDAATFGAQCAALSSSPNASAGKEALEQILAVDDFLSFKKMMVKRNMELELEALKMLQGASAEVSAATHEAPPPPPAAPEEEDEEAMLKRVLELSLIESYGESTLTDVTPAEIAEAEKEKEEADLKMALALSLQLEDEQKKMQAMEASQSAAAQPPPARPAPALAPVTAAAPPSAPPPPAKTLAPIAAVVPSSAKQMQEVRASEAAAKAAEARQRAEKEKKEATEARLAGEASASAKQQAEMKARAEHLRKQRDLILAQRRKQRESEAAAYTPPPAGSAAPAAPLAASAAPMRRAAGYSEDKEVVSDEQRAMLSRALATSMKATLLGGDSLGLEQMLVQAEKRADLEATKAALRREAARAPQ